MARYDEGLDYPIPSVLGGTFEGTFSMNSDAATCTDSVDFFPLFDVSISIFGEDGSLVQTIGDYPEDAEFREFSWNQGTAYIGKSFQIANQLQDLQLTFGFDTSPGDGVISLDALLNADPTWGFIETDAPSQVSGFVGWNVRIDSFTFAADVVPSTSQPTTCIPVPEPKQSGSLLIMATTCLLAARRKRRSFCRRDQGST